MYDMKSDLQQLIEKWESQKQNDPLFENIYQKFIDEANEFLKQEQRKELQHKLEKESLLLSQNDYSTKFKYTIKTNNGKILVQEIVSFGSEDNPFPKDWESDEYTVMRMNEYCDTFLRNNFEVYFDQDLTFDIVDDNNTIEEEIQLNLQAIDKLLKSKSICFKSEKDKCIFIDMKTNEELFTVYKIDKNSLPEEQQALTNSIVGSLYNF